MGCVCVWCGLIGGVLAIAEWCSDLWCGCVGMVWWWGGFVYMDVAALVASVGSVGTVAGVG